MADEDVLTAVAIALAAIFALLLLFAIYMIIRLRKKRKHQYKKQNQHESSMDENQLRRRHIGSDRLSSRQSENRSRTSHQSQQPVSMISGRHIPEQHVHSPITYTHVPRYLWRYLYKYNKKISQSVLTGGGPEERKNRAQEMQQMIIDDDTLPNTLPRSTLHRSLPDIRENSDENVHEMPYASGMHLSQTSSHELALLNHNNGHFPGQASSQKDNFCTNRTYVNIAGPSTVVLNGLDYPNREPTKPQQHPPSISDSIIAEGQVSPPQFGTYSNSPLGTMGSWAFLSSDEHYNQLRNQQVSIQQHQQRQYGMVFPVAGDYQMGEWITTGMHSLEKNNQIINSKDPKVLMVGDKSSNVQGLSTDVHNVTTISTIGFPY